MSNPVRHSISKVAAGLVAVVIVFGFAALMVLKRYDPAVIATVVTGTSLAAAELVRLFHAAASAGSGPDSAPGERS